MKLVSVQVQNYKCVEDSDEFSVNDLTCLAGKNESGKTALLEALRRLNPVEGSTESDYDPLLEYPRRKYTPNQEITDPVLTTKWELSDDDITEVEKIIGEGALGDTTISIQRGYDKLNKWTIPIVEANVIGHIRSNAGDGELHNQSPEQLAEEILQDRLPTFLYFPNYGTLPGRISVDQFIAGNPSSDDAEKYRHFGALLELAGTSVNDLKNAAQSEELVARLEAVSNRVSDKVFEYWSQNRHLQVEIRCDPARPNDPEPYNSGEVVQLRVRNNRHRVTTPFDARSAGFVWFLSFLIWFDQMEKAKGSNLVILLDEPGLSLHATAQADLLRYIRAELLPKYQVIYTTHSPFLVDTSDLLSVRTVEDVTGSSGTPLGTKVGDKDLSSDSETLFPLRAALGYDITQSLFIGENCLLVEGPSDLLYLRWASQQLTGAGRTSLDRRWTIVPAGGISKLGTFASLFAGNHLNVAILTDFQQGEKGKVRDLQQHQMLAANRVFTAAQFVEKDEADTEDLVGWELYRKVVNHCFGLKGGKKLPKTQPNGPAERVTETAKAHFQTVVIEGPELGHLSPAVFLLEHAGRFQDQSGTEKALDNFEKLFNALNGTIASIT
jgi:predicted ATP-dependent endonuclease of OLD family